MEQSVLPLAALILLSYGGNTLLKKASSMNRYKSNNFPKCPACGSIGMATTLNEHIIPLPDEIEFRVSKLKLEPAKVVTRYVCPKACTNMWYMPKLPDMEKGILRSRRL